MTVIDCHESDEFKKLIAGDAIVDFGAQWCGPCRRIEPIFKELAKKNKHIKFIHVDIDEASDSMPNELQDIDSVPTFHIYKEGKRIDTLMGADPGKLKKAVEKLNEGKEKDEKEEKKDEEKKDGEDKKEEKKDEEKKDEEEKKPASRKNSDEDSKVGKVYAVEKGAEYEKLVSSGNALVDFSAEWCGPCQKIAPFFDELAKNYVDVKFLRIDIDETDDDLKNVLSQIRSVPTFFVYKDGKIAEKFSGANPHKLREKAEELSAIGGKKKEEDEEEKNDEKKKTPSPEPKKSDDEKKSPKASSSSSEDEKEAKKEAKKEAPAAEEKKEEAAKDEEGAKKAKKDEEEKKEEPKADAKSADDAKSDK